MSATATGRLERTAQALVICIRANAALKAEREAGVARELERRAGKPQRAAGRGGNRPTFRDSYGQDIL